MFITLAATLAYLGLAVPGWGGLAAFVSPRPLIALTIALFAMSGAALFSRGILSSGEREDRANRWVIVAFTLIGLHDTSTQLDLFEKSLDPVTRALETPVETDRLLPLPSRQDCRPTRLLAGKRSDQAGIISRSGSNNDCRCVQVNAADCTHNRSNVPYRSNPETI